MFSLKILKNHLDRICVCKAISNLHKDLNVDIKQAALHFVFPPLLSAINTQKQILSSGE